MDKSIWKSKTLWGFGLTGLIAVAQILGVTYSDTLVMQIVQILTAVFGVYGLRSSIK
jgi:hypothetical protein